LEEIISLYKEVKNQDYPKRKLREFIIMINRSLAKKYLELYGKSE